MDAIRVMGFWGWLWCRTGGYRAFMRWAHRWNWHHTKTIGPLEDGAMQEWCQWCGLRDSNRPAGSLLRKPTAQAPPGCYCNTRCRAPIIMGSQQPCRDPEKAKGFLYQVPCKSTLARAGVGVSAAIGTEDLHRIGVAE